MQIIIKLKFKSEIFYKYQKLSTTKKKARKRVQNLSKEKEKKQQYGRECYKNLSEDEKQKLVEYRKKSYRMRKNALI